MSCALYLGEELQLPLFRGVKEVDVHRYSIRLVFINYYEYDPDRSVCSGQSSSVIDDQNTQIITTANSVKSVSNKDPSIFPLVPVQM